MADWSGLRRGPMVEQFPEGLLVDVWEYLLPEIDAAQASGTMRRAADCAAKYLLTHRYGAIATMEPSEVCDAATWRGLAACERSARRIGFFCSSGARALGFWGRPALVTARRARVRLA